MRLSAQGERLRISAPKGTLTAALRDQIARHKHEILLFLASRYASEVTTDAVGRVTSGGASPLSFAQERLWFLEQLAPNSSVFNLCRAVRISGTLNVGALEASLNEIVRHQESLRTIFTTVDGIPVQTVAPVEHLDLTRVDLSDLPETKRESELQRVLLEEAEGSFDLASGRLLRARLARLGENKHVLMVSTHHLVSDAWSMGILTRELWSFYEGYCHGRMLRSAEPACQYRDYAVWQRERLGCEDARRQLDYWKERLASPPVLDLPADRPRPVQPSSRGARASIDLPPRITAALNELSRREGATLFMTLLAAFQLLLFRYSGQEDIAVGSPVANRDRAGIENLIGLFVNTLVLRVKLSGALSFRQLLRRVRETCLDAYANQEVPFERIVAELKPHRDLNRNPLFQVMLVLQNTPSQRPAPFGLKLEPLDVESATAQFDLSLYLRERSGRLLGFFEYDADIFAAATIERMARHLQKVLAEIVVNPDQSIESLPLLSEAEHRRVLVEWNATQAEYPEHSCIHQLFEAQAEQTPDAIALQCADKKLTYRELNRRANRLARHLMSMGIGPEALAGVMMERSPEMVIGLLAILKAGGAYLALDPAYPKERLSFMLKDARIGILLAQKKYFSQFSDQPARVVLLDEFSFAAGGAESNVDGGATVDSAAYVIYTSGSTGAPKGVVGLHRGAVNRFAWMWRRYPFSPGEKSCQKTSPGFVDSIWEFFGALLQGVPTIIVPEHIAKEPELLARHLQHHRVTRLVLVPSLLREMLDHCAPHVRPLETLKYCISSGETLSAELAARFREILPNCRLINLYGSSELAGDVTCYEVGADDRRSAIPVGRPISNTQIYLLDAHLQPVPVGVVGELYVGGANLARGYLHRPDLTAEKFIANPFDPTKASRLYRTGDLARHRGDGNIEFFGRVDDQVKIRGRRIEPGEIAFVLNSHPAVRDCVVVARDDERHPSIANENPQSFGAHNAQTQLVAYVVARDPRPSRGELRAFLKERLPDPMIPAALVFIDGLPLLPSGKVDRRGLPAPNQAVLLTQATSEPRTEIESVIAAIWEGVLKVERVGADDNFFELGGHSLLAAQVAARLRAAVNKPISIRDLFSAPTVAGLAALVERTIRADQKEELPPITPVSRKRSKPLSASQEQLFLFSQLFGGGDFLNMPYAYRLSGRPDLPALRKSINEIVRRHETLRSFFAEFPEGPVQLVRRTVKISLPFVDLSSHRQEQREQEFVRISRDDAGRCFDLEKAPLLRVKLLRLAADEHILLVTLHHMICDQWSMGIFRRELAELYRAYSVGLPSPLPDLPIRYSDFASWQQELMTQGLLDRQIEYWHKQLSGYPAPLTFHRGKKALRRARYQSARHPIEIDTALTARIKAFAGQHNCTPFMILITALNVLLHRYTGRSDIPIGTLVANRGRAGTEGLIGYFVNALILRTRFSSAISCVDLVKKVRRVCLEAYAHQDVPFEQLETLLQKNRKRRDMPLYQVMLNYRNFSAPAEQVNGLTIASWNGKNRAADPGIAISRLDLIIHLRQVSTQLTGAVNYKTDLFDLAAITEFVANYGQILSRIVERPDQRISDVSLT